MRRFSVALAFSAFLLAGCGQSEPTQPGAVGGAPALPAINPLATNDQKALDALALKLHTEQALLFAPIKAEASAACVAARLRLPSAEAQSRLAQAMDELQFASIQKVVNGDVYHPKVYWVNAPPRSWFGGITVPGSRYSYDNPDNIYRLIPIDGASRYVLRGQRFGSGPADVTFSLISNANTQGTVAVLAGPDLVVGPDGRYSITIDEQPANGRINHIQATRQAVQLFVRNNLADWQRETPDALAIERIGGDGGNAPQTEAAILANSLRSFQEAIAAYCVGALGLKTMSQPVNTLAQPVQSDSLGTLVTQANTFGHFNLADDEALVATVNLGGAGYFVLPATDPWMITVDPTGFTNSLNNVQARPDPDGRYTFVIAPRDPGVYNWIDTGGLHEGTLFVRWQNLPDTAPASGSPAIDVRLAKQAELRGLLPATTVWVTPAERAAQQAERLRGYQRRIASP